MTPNQLWTVGLVGNNQDPYVTEVCCDVTQDYIATCNNYSLCICLTHTTHTCTHTHMHTHTRTHNYTLLQRHAGSSFVWCSWDGPLSLENDQDEVVVPEFVCPLREDQLDELYTVVVSPRSPSPNYGIDLYQSVVQFIEQHYHDT